MSEERLRIAEAERAMLALMPLSVPVPRSRPTAACATELRSYWPTSRLRRATHRWRCERQNPDYAILPHDNFF
jgi:hypothetical protein